MDKHVNYHFVFDDKIKFVIEFFIAELIDKKELPAKNVVLKELTQEMTYVFFFYIIKSIGLFL